MVHREFDAYDYRSDGSFVPAHYAFDGDGGRGFTVRRDGRVVLELGPGYRLLRVRECGICSTDLARHHLPFPLPQVIGHEVLAVGDDGRRYVVEINASHAARGVAHDCAFCRAGLPTHCPERVTLGIHDLPGGFGPWILAPIAACLPVPDAVPDAAAVLVEPLAAALHAVRTVAPRAGERIAVLGARRLGMLVVAALAAVRERAAPGQRFTVAAIVRDGRLDALAKALGADEVHVAPFAGPTPAFDVVIDTTGAPAGLDEAVRLARREVHLKSTHGRPAGGLLHLTELVVDELTIAPLGDPMAWRGRRVAWLAAAPPPPPLVAAAEVVCADVGTAAAHFARARTGLPRADVAVVDSCAQIDAAIRPFADRHDPLVAPRGRILLHPSFAAPACSPLLHAVVGRGLRLTSSRCGDFRDALELLVAEPALRAVGDHLVSHRFPAASLPHAFAAAGRRDCIKAVVIHGDVDG